VCVGGTSSNLERHGMINETLLAEHELRTFVGELEEHAHLVAKVLEEVISWFPAKYENTKDELQTKTPQHWAPSHLLTTHLIGDMCDRHLHGRFWLSTTAMLVSVSS